MFVHRTPVVLLYHGIGGVSPVAGAAFERHIAFLKKHFDIIPLESDSGGGDKPAIALTFDDGYRNNADTAVPILRHYDVPATFFVCGRHSRGNELLWFSYLDALQQYFRGNGFRYHGEFIDMAPGKRQESIGRLRAHLLSLRPHPAAMYGEIETQLPDVRDMLRDEDLRLHYSGLTEDQIEELARDWRFEVRAHTEDHPFMSACEPEEQARQLMENKAWIETMTGSVCSSVAYPSGDYDVATIGACKSAGLKRGFAVIGKGLNCPEFEIPRVGIYSGSIWKLGVKALFGRVLRTLSIPVG